LGKKRKEKEKKGKEGEKTRNAQYEISGLTVKR
jgi:hypothetical protein